MKKQIVGGLFALVLTALSGTVFSTAAPRVRERDNVAPPSARLAAPYVQSVRTASTPTDSVRG